MPKYLFLFLLSCSAMADTVTINGASNTVVYAQEYSATPTTDCLIIKNSSNVTVIKSKFTNCRIGLIVQASSNIIIKDSWFEDVAAGINVSINSSGIKVFDNHFLNFHASGSIGQMIQFNTINSAGNMVVGNYVLNQPTLSTTKDIINLFKSGGVAGSPLLIANNKINGGNDPSGVGILVGDGSTPGSYVDVRDNILINPGQAAVAIGGGHDINVTGNKAYGMMQSNLTWIGMYANSLQLPSATPPTNDPNCYNILFDNNSMDWTNKYGAKSNFVDTGECTNVTQTNNNFDNTNDLSGLNFNFWN
ncbi:MAG: hypothetical protein WC901_00990 [Candidatus Margulisiibacteriota bacterium]